MSIGIPERGIARLLICAAAALWAGPGLAAVASSEAAQPKGENNTAIAELYANRCKSCHPNHGPVIRYKWLGAGPALLASFIRTSMPPGTDQPIDGQTATQLANYLFELATASAGASSSTFKAFRPYSSRAKSNRFFRPIVALSKASGS